MKIFYKKPKNDVKFSCFRDSRNEWEVWYEWEKVVYLSAPKENIPDELRAFIEKWTKKIQEYKKTFRELYPVKNAKIVFLYKDQVYYLYPMGVGATYESDFITGVMCEYDWDALFEEYQREIRDDMEKELGIKYSAYYGMLD